MSRKLPPLNALKAFEAAARHLNFTKAAEDLFVTQAAISHQIKLLEEFLDIKLFHRRNRLLELTELGLQYFQDIQPLLQNIALVTEKIRQVSRRQILSISVPQTFGMHWLVPRLSDFHQKFPDVEVRIKGVDQDEGQIGKEIDVAIYYGIGNWKNLNAVRLADARLVILASPKLIKAFPILQPKDLASHNFLHVGTHNKWQKMLDYLKLDNINGTSGSVFSHTFMALQAALHQQGIAIANQILAQHEIDQGNLVEPFKTDLYDDKSFYVVYPNNQPPQEKVNLFIDWITQEIQKDVS